MYQKLAFVIPAFILLLSVTHATEQSGFGIIELPNQNNSNKNYENNINNTINQRQLAEIAYKSNLIKELHGKVEDLIEISNMAISSRDNTIMDLNEALAKAQENQAEPEEIKQLELQILALNNKLAQLIKSRVDIKDLENEITKLTQENKQQVDKISSHKGLTDKYNKEVTECRIESDKRIDVIKSTIKEMQDYKAQVIKQRELETKVNIKKTNLMIEKQVLLAREALLSQMDSLKKSAAQALLTQTQASNKLANKKYNDLKNNTDQLIEQMRLEARKQIQTTSTINKTYTELKTKMDQNQTHRGVEEKQWNKTITTLKSQTDNLKKSAANLETQLQTQLENSNNNKQLIKNLKQKISDLLQQRKNTDQLEAANATLIKKISDLDYQHERDLFLVQVEKDKYDFLAKKTKEQNLKQKTESLQTSKNQQSMKDYVYLETALKEKNDLVDSLVNRIESLKARLKKLDKNPYKPINNPYLKSY